MKRGKPLERRTGLSQKGKGGANPPRPDALAKPKRRPAARRRQVLNGAKWRAAVFRMHGDRCVVTGEPAEQAHHVIPLAYLLDHIPARLRDEGLDGKQLEERLRQIARDPRNGMPLTELAHTRHERALARVPWELLAPSHRLFAAELGLTWLLERTYPKGAPPGPSGEPDDARSSYVPRSTYRQ